MPPQSHLCVKMNPMKGVQKSSPLLANDPMARDAKTVKSRPGFRDKIRLIGTPEASRNDGRRRSID